MGRESGKKEVCGRRGRREKGREDGRGHKERKCGWEKMTERERDDVEVNGREIKRRGYE